MNKIEELFVALQYHAATKDKNGAFLGGIPDDAKEVAMVAHDAYRKCRQAIDRATENACGLEEEDTPVCMVALLGLHQISELMATYAEAPAPGKEQYREAKLRTLHQTLVDIVSALDK